MAAAIQNFTPGKLAIGPGRVYYGVAIPGAGARATVAADADGFMVPDLTASPNAKHIGYTAGGIKFGASKTVERYYADEFADPIFQAVTTTEASVSADVQLVDDFDVLGLLAAGIGTRVSATGIESLTGGAIPLVYTGILVVYRTLADLTKFGYFHLYKAVNESGFDISLARKGLSQTGVSFKGVAVTGRAATDTTWNRWSNV